MAAAAALCGCSRSDGWTVKGTIQNASEGDKLALLGFNAGVGAWYLIDSVNISDNGSFSFTSAQPSPYSDVYSLSYGGKNIFFPIDSVETLTIEADANAFDTSFAVTGSDLAEAMLNVDRAIAAVAARGADAPLTDSLLKRQLTQTAIDDANGLIAYYIISKQVGGKPIFDPRNPADLRSIGAVANNFRRNRPDDPRTLFLENIYLANRQRPASGTSVEATQVGLFEIHLYDSKGVRHSLTDMASKGKPVILSFVNYGAEATAPYNVLLNEIYAANRDALNIYQVAVGDEEMVWKDSAKNLPWVSVYYPSTSGTEILTDYNVGVIPMTYIIDRDGEIAERVTDPTALASAVKKYL